MNSFNVIAPFYDLIARIVFGKNLLESRLWLVHQLPTSGTLLILGGGTGRILPALFRHAPDMKIYFLEASTKMIELASGNSPKGQNIEFIHSHDWSSFNKPVDHIFAGFFLDCFSESKITEGIRRLSRLGEHVTWYVADFEISILNHAWDRFKIRLSIIFFNLLSDLKLNHLSDVFGIFSEEGYKTLNFNHFSNKTICSKILRRISH